MYNVYYVSIFVEKVTRDLTISYSLYSFFFFFFCFYVVKSYIDYMVFDVSRVIIWVIAVVE